MFNSTHTLIGLALARSGMSRWARYGTVTAVVAANLPDVDIAFGLVDTASYLQYHRGLTHALIGIPFLSLLLAAAVHRLSALRGQPPAGFWPLLAISLLTMFTHPALDYTNTYGLRPFLPIDGSWFYGDALFVIDPVIDIALVLALVAGLCFRRWHRVLAAAALGVVLVYIGARVELRDRAREQLSEFTAGLTGFERSFVSPQMMNPLAWVGIVETASEVLRVQIDVRTGASVPSMRLAKISDSEIGKKASRSRSAAAFLGFARFPLTRVYRMENGYRVLFVDFRYYRPNPGTGFAAEVVLDNDLKVIHDRIGFDEPIRFATEP